MKINLILKITMLKDKHLFFYWTYLDLNFLILNIKSMNA